VDCVFASRAAWARFYYCACQYCSAGFPAMDLFTASDTIAVMLIRVIKRLRTVKALEQVAVTSGVGVAKDIFSPIYVNPGLQQVMFCTCWLWTA